MPKFERMDRLSEEMRREIDKIVREEIRDPRVNGVYSITAVETTKELAVARVRVSVMADKDAQKAMVDALNHATGYIRKTLGKRLVVRAVPELHFIVDDAIAYGVEMSKKIDDIVKQDDARRQDT